jgi:hypothetical protein
MKAEVAGSLLDPNFIYINMLELLQSNSKFKKMEVKKRPFKVAEVKFQI